MAVIWSSETSCFWVVTPCSSKKPRYFGVPYRPYLRGWRESQARNRRSRQKAEVETTWSFETSGFIVVTLCSLEKSWRFGRSWHFHLRFSPTSADLLLVLLFYPGDMGDMFFRNVGLSPSYMALEPRRPYSLVTAVRTSDPTILRLICSHCS
jgi:hypothetical protein